jgi:integrase
MARRGKRHNLGPGLWADDGGLAATVKVGSGPQREQRFTPTDDRDADIRRMQRWQLHTRAELLGDQPSKAARDSLTASIPRLLATMPAGSTTRHDYEKLLATWTATPLGAMPRHMIRRVHVLTQLSAWESDEYSSTTLNHRVRALRKLYDVLDADDEYAINPCAKIAKYTEPEPAERGTTYDIIEGILAWIPDIGFAATRGAPRPAFNKSKLRLRVMAWTGLPPAQIRKIQPQHIRWTEKELDVTPRRKGKGVKARRLPLLEEAVTALRGFDAAGAYGAFSNAAPWMAWQRAKKRYLEDARTRLTPAAYAELERVVTPLRPYDLRHSFAAMVYETTENQYAVKDLLLHGSLQTSERYIRRAVIKVSQSAIAAVQATRTVPAGASRSGPRLAVSGRKRAISLPSVHSGTTAKARVSSNKSRN